VALLLPPRLGGSYGYGAGMADTSSDIVVVGGGIVGLSVTHALRERGVDVVCLDDDEPGQAQSAGRARIFRHFLATPQLAALAVEARTAWDAWSQRAGEPLLLTDGWLRLGGDRAADLAFLRDAGIPATELEPEDAVARMPVMTRPDGPLLFDPLAGSARTDATIAALVRWIGSALRRVRVERIDADRGSAVLRTSEGTHTDLRRCRDGPPRCDRGAADRPAPPRAPAPDVPSPDGHRRGAALLERSQCDPRRVGLRRADRWRDVRRGHRGARRLSGGRSRHGRGCP
jgi:hypothetical protein